MSGEEQLAGGNVTQPSRIGGHVHRESGPWTPVVHALLNHLHRVGFEGAPRVVGFDDAGREVLTYVEGDAGSTVFPSALLHERGLVTLGRFVRSFHDAARTFDPGADAVYRIGPKAIGPGEIVCHGDLGFWNTIWRAEEIVALIDWDFAEPLPPAFDVALAAMPVIPFGPDESAVRIGLAAPVDRRARLAALCAGYGDITPTEVVDAAARSLRIELERLQSFGAAGREPWASSLADGRQVKLFEGVARWIDENRDVLV